MISPNNQTNLQNQNQQGRLSNAFFIHGGRDAAMNYPVAAGYDAFLVDEDLKMFFIKSNNIPGMGMTLREFKYEEVTPKQNIVSAVPDGFDPSKYVTKDDFNVLLEEVKKLQGGKDKGHHYNNIRNNRRSRNGKSYDE